MCLFIKVDLVGQAFEGRGEGFDRGERSSRRNVLLLSGDRNEVELIRRAKGSEVLTGTAMPTTPLNRSGLERPAS
jgi:hypothetical protein